MRSALLSPTSCIPAPAPLSAAAGSASAATGASSRRAFPPAADADETGADEGGWPWPAPDVTPGAVFGYDAGLRLSDQALGRPAALSGAAGLNMMLAVFGLALACGALGFGLGVLFSFPH